MNFDDYLENRCNLNEKMRVDARFGAGTVFPPSWHLADMARHDGKDRRLVPV